MRAWWDRNRPALALAVLSPLIAEVLSGSTKISVLFFAPLAFVLGFGGLMLLYGGGALLIREASVRWGKGWASVLLLGAAYGIVEEGLAVHTFFQPSGTPVDALAGFGRFDGVNMLWALGLTVYHSVISIALPILLIQLMYPSTRGQAFLDRPGLTAVAIGFVGIVALFAAVTPSFPSSTLFAVSLVAIGGLIAAARLAPRDLLRPRAGPPRAPWWAFAVFGSMMMLDWLIAGLGGPALFGSAWLAAAVFVGVLVAILAFVLLCAGTDDVGISQYWFAAGMLGFFFGWDAILEFILVPGILLVSAGFVGYLYWLRHRLPTADSLPPVPGGISRMGPT